MYTYQEKLKQSDFFKVVFVGDMQTSQPYTRPSWTDWIQRAFWENGEVQTSWRRRVFNTAVDRATPRHVYTYYREYVGQYKPDLVVLNFGISPLYPVFDEKNFSLEIDTLLDTLGKNNQEAVIVAPYPLLNGEKRSEALSLVAQLKQKSIERNLLFVDLYHEFDEVELSKVFTQRVVLRNELFRLEPGEMDVVSLNSVGNYIVARKVLKDVFLMGLPEKSVGDFVVPNLELVKRWV